MKHLKLFEAFQNELTEDQYADLEEIFFEFVKTDPPQPKNPFRKSHSPWESDDRRRLKNYSRTIRPI